MCGIVGFWSPAGSVDRPRDVVREMCGTLAHRGPDDRGSWLDDDTGLVLGHTRLSIVDLSPTGHQPMVSRTQRFVIVYNGEVYNHRELRRRLTAVGTSFRGHSDTEVLTAALEAWGIEATIAELAGMFSLAIYDRTTRLLHLVRDRLGEKPLYHGLVAGHLLFGSELKALRPHPSWTGRIDTRALNEYLRHGYVPGPESIYEGIQKLQPGTRATYPVGRSDMSPIIDTYWSALDVRSPVRLSDRDVVDALDDRLHTTIASEMLADVPVGAFLSGGTDSSLIVAIMQQESRRPVRTFTIGFEEDWFDEAPYAAAVARHLGTDHTTLYISPSEAREVVPRLPTIYDEPFADSSQIPTFLVAKLAAQHVTVALSGDGADELFGGYRRYSTVWRAWRRAARAPVSLRSGLARLIHAVPPRSWDRLLKWLPRALVSDRLSGERLHMVARTLPARNPNDLYSRIAHYWREPSTVGLGEEREAGPDSDLLARVAPAEGVEAMMLADLTRYLPDDILVKVDRATMAVSLESRAPFLDHRIVEFALGLPMRQKICNGEGKWILRRLLSRYVPDDLVERPKAGFSIPIGEWLRGPLRPWAEALLAERRIRTEGYLRPEPIRARWRQHCDGSRDWTASLWTVLMFQAWLADISV